ncbi:putative periplasmic lipoprotein|nr:putative periplasmic lipoprotein [Candidatus Pantoea persica]
MRPWLMCMPLLLTLAGCSSDKPMIDTSQSLVMESSVLSAGIITDEPLVDE